jgi:hypothetical protein
MIVLLVGLVIGGILGYVGHDKIKEQLNKFN